MGNFRFKLKLWVILPVLNILLFILSFPLALIPWLLINFPILGLVDAVALFGFGKTGDLMSWDILSSILISAMIGYLLDKPIFSVRKIAIVASIFLSATLAFILLIGSKTQSWWQKVEGAKITFNGSLSSDSKVFRSKSGDLYIWLTESERLHYIVHPEKKMVAMTNPDFYFKISNYLFSGKDPVDATLLDPNYKDPETPLGYTGPPIPDNTRIPADTDLIISPNHLEFKGFADKIKIDF